MRTPPVGVAASPYVQLTNNYAFPGLSATDGVQWLDLTGITGRGAGVLAAPIATSSGYYYDLSFDLGAAFYRGSFGAATVDALVNGALLGSFTSLPPATTGLNWNRFTVSFLGTGAPVRVGLYASFSTASSNLGVALDNVVLTSRLAPTPAVPEPATWAMLIGGFAVAGAALRSRARVTLRFA
ncbi:MAG: PEPxxWA-CTERM sorting domain-containing protein [Sphingomonadales bacterium]|nr:PEPxxWA-CTERM sorting domain-containing protein [Sphingomonadales bacterium]